jgi:hypothetical protein
VVRPRRQGTGTRSSDGHDRRLDGAFAQRPSCSLSPHRSHGADGTGILSGGRRSFTGSAHTAADQRTCGGGVARQFGGAGAAPGSSAIFVAPAAGGAATSLVEVARPVVDTADWSRTGNAIVYTAITAETGADIWMLPLSGRQAAGQPIPLLQSSANESEGQLSPDGKWLAYFSDEAGQGQIYLRRFGADGRLTAGRWQVSNAARGMNARWRADSKELFYLDLPGASRTAQLLAVPIGDEPDPVGTPLPLFDIRTPSPPPQDNRFIYAPSANGQRFLVNVFASRLNPSLEIIFNWSPK